MCLSLLVPNMKVRGGPLIELLMRTDGRTDGLTDGRTEILITISRKDIVFRLNEIIMVNQAKILPFKMCRFLLLINLLFFNKD